MASSAADTAASYVGWDLDHLRHGMAGSMHWLRPERTHRLQVGRGLEGRHVEGRDREPKQDRNPRSSQLG